jgi:virginiamycin B lyase
MNARRISLYVSIYVLAVAAAALLDMSEPRAQRSAALAGAVTSAQEGAMEGVLVTAKKNGSTIATTVVTDDKGRYSFPADRLDPGHYAIKIRAAGYIVRGGLSADVAAGKTATRDVTLTNMDTVAPQMTSSDWLISMPGTDDQKAFLQDCVGCHTLERVVSSSYTADGFMKVIPRMGGYAPGSPPQRPQKLVPGPRGDRGIVDLTKVREAAAYLASVNLSKDAMWKYPLKVLPRPKGRGTQVIITTYDLARPEAMPHDVIVENGKAWYTDFGSQFIGEMDIKTGAIVDHPVPVLKPEEPRGLLEAKADRDGKIWASMMYQGGIAVFDPKTNQVKTYKVPDQWQGPNTQESMVSPVDHNVDGFVWTNNQEDHSILRVNAKTGEWENLGVLKDQNGHTIVGYDIPTDEKNNLYILEFGGTGTKVGRIDAQAKTLRTWTPAIPYARPRRGHFDEHGMLWFGEYGGNAVGRFDPKTEKIMEWPMPVKWHMPYDADTDSKGDVWNASMLSDRVVRLNPKTGEMVTYLLPDSTNVRRVFVDKATNALWIGNNLGNSIYKIEALN